jgi:DNA-binding transcriptional regulator YhcF (GntR family)
MSKDSNKGFIKIDRSLLDWEWYDHVPTKVLFMHLLLKANWKPTRYRGHDVPTGSLVTGVNSLAEQTGLSVQQVRTAINNLKHDEITIKATNKFSIISIVKWANYQSNNKQPTNKQQADNKPDITPPTTSKELNNLIKLLNAGAREEVAQAFLEHRSNHAKKPKNTEYAIRLVARKLETLKARGYDPNELLNTAIEKNWITVYEPNEWKGNNNGNSSQGKRKSNSDGADEALRKHLDDIRAEAGIGEEESSDSGDSQAELRHIPHLRQDTRTVSHDTQGVRQDVIGIYDG